MVILLLSHHNLTLISLSTSLLQGGSADSAGIKVGDVLLAVQNASVENADLEEVLNFIGNAPKVINLRFLRIISGVGSEEC